MEHKTLELSKISLDLENPRHKPFEDEREVIEYLCKEEKIIELAKDIAKKGLNRLELFAVIKKEDGSFFCAEGNRRVCALKLLENPTLAPDDLREYFIKASENMRPLEQLNVVEYIDRDEVSPWLDRIHAGPNKGIGRRQWSPEQKARNSSDNKRKFVLAVLKHAKELKLISQEEADGRFSTVKNQFSNPLLRDVFGLKSRDVNALKNLSGANLFAFKKFIADVVAENITSWTQKKETEIYAKNLIKAKGLIDKNLPNTSLTSAGGAVIKSPPKPPPPLKPTEPQKSEFIPLNAELVVALKEIPSYKLESIYFSLCKISLKEHTPLLYVGAWMFIETLTALCERNDTTDFYSYLSVQKMTSLSLGAKNEIKAIREAVKRISEAGNTTKHNKTSAAFNSEQLENDFKVMKSLLVALAKEAKGKTK